MGRILVVDDEAKILRLLTAYLKDAGHQVYTANDGEEALAQFKRHAPDLVVLDLMLPEISGEEICRYVREVSNTPIVMLTAKSTEDDKVYGLELGADDYLTKPFSPRELMARIKAVLRRNNPGEPEVTSSDGLVKLHQDQGRVWVNNREVSLTPTEFKILHIFLANPGRIFNKLDLAERVFGLDHLGYEDSIYVHVKNLRQKMMPLTSTKYIQTVYGMGYRWEVKDGQ